jgi:uncharacterized protein (TIGR00255 family)
MVQYMQSMTAFAKAKKMYAGIEISVEIQSVNKKFLDFHIKLPYEWLFFEPIIRNSLSEHIERGNITLSAHLVYRSTDALSVELNKAYAEALKTAMHELAAVVGHTAIEPKELFAAIVREKGLFQPQYAIQENSELQAALKETVLLALCDLQEMKKREGALLKNELLSRLKTLADVRSEIEKNSHNATSRYRTRITELLAEFKDADSDNEMRIAKEVALMADRLDIAEELSRLGFHIAHFEEVVADKPSGKVLEFILQELLREINTIGSKSQEASISKLVILAKSEIEKMKEQIQNVE